MDVMLGFKHTKVGLIPEDWECVETGKLVDLLTGFPFPSNGYSTSGVRLLRGSNVKRGVTNWSEDNTEYWPEVGIEIRKYTLKCGDIVIAMDGSLVGRSFAMLSEDDVPAVLLQRVARLRSTRINQRLLKAWICSERFTEHCDAVKTVTAIPHISPANIRSFSIAHPPTNTEQEAIANALRDADALIESLVQLIGKKRNIKQGAIQELLTGKKRLPGFSGEWKECNLKECLLAKPDYGINAPGVPDTGSLPAYIRITDIDDHGRFIPATRVAVSHPEALNYLLSNNEIVFARTGASVGKSYLYNQDDGPLVFAGFLIRARIDCEKLCPAFFAAFTHTGRYWNWVRVMSMRSGQPGINGNEYAMLDLHLPPTVKEQEAIATILSDMDGEITMQEAKLVKARQLKQGMMQELLTGKIRLLDKHVGQG